jgi:hypothetical protein
MKGADSSRDQLLRRGAAGLYSEQLADIPQPRSMPGPLQSAQLVESSDLLLARALKGKHLDGRHRWGEIDSTRDLLHPC